MVTIYRGECQLSYLEFDSKNNHMRVIRGDSRYRDGIRTVDSEENAIGFVTRRRECIGAQINNFLTPSELQGFKAEEIFQAMLTRNEVPSLYVGQGPSGIEYSKPLKKGLESNRPDFLVNFQDIGSLFFDVKCRTKIGLNSGTKPYFYLFKAEADQLLNLHENLLIPVWVAFYDKSNLKHSIESTPRKFSLLPISLYKKLRDGIKERLKASDYDLISTFRIPGDLLTEVENELNFSVGFNTISDELLDKVALKYTALIRIIKDEIKNLIRSEQVVKSHVAERLLAGSLKSSFRAEIEDCIRSLIDDETIVFEKRKPLRLSGE